MKSKEARSRYVKREKTNPYKEKWKNRGASIAKAEREGE